MYDTSEHYFVYILLNPLKDYLPFYVGKGSRNRIKEHLWETAETTSNRHKFNTVKKILASGFDEIPFVKWIDGIDEETAYRIEEVLIRWYGRRVDGGILTNLSLSQRPPSRFGMTHSDETKCLISKNRKGKGRGSPSAEHRRKIAVALKGKPKSPETIEKRRETMKAKSEEEIENMRTKMRHARSEQIFTAESNRKRALANTGKKRSEETKRKISEALKRRHAEMPT
jgi:hypothetical protein